MKKKSKKFKTQAVSAIAIVVFASSALFGAYPTVRDTLLEISLILIVLIAINRFIIPPRGHVSRRQESVENYLVVPALVSSICFLAVWRIGGAKFEQLSNTVMVYAILGVIVAGALGGSWGWAKSKF